MTKKIIKDSAKFLVDNGLLFEINRAVLHPRGLALAVSVDDNGCVSFDTIWDCRDEGIIFPSESFIDGQNKLDKYTKDNPHVQYPQTDPGE